MPRIYPSIELLMRQIETLHDRLGRIAARHAEESREYDLLEEAMSYLAKASVLLREHYPHSRFLP